MKRKILVVLVVAIASIGLASAQTGKKKTDAPVVMKTFSDTISYIIGSDVGGNLKKSNIDINSDIFMVGLKKGLNNNDSVFTQEKRQEIMTKFQKDLQAKQAVVAGAEAEKNKAVCKSFLEENKKKPGVITLPSGLQYKVLVQGTGPKPAATDEVTVNYEGKFIDGKIFDSSYERKEPATFPLNGVIKGWTEGLQYMSTGSTYELYIPYDLGYGDKGTQGIPGCSVLIFKVELISIKGK